MLLYTKKEMLDWIDRISKYDYIKINGGLNTTVEIRYVFDKNDYPMVPDTSDIQDTLRQTEAIYIREVYMYLNKEIKSGDERKYTITNYGTAIDKDLAILILQVKSLRDLYSKLRGKLHDDKDILTDKTLTKKCNDIDVDDYDFNCVINKNTASKFGSAVVNTIDSKSRIFQKSTAWKGCEE